MAAEFKTSVRILGDRIDEFRALCLLRGRRPFQLAADYVLEGINRDMRDPETGSAVAELAAIHRRRREEREGKAAGRDRGPFRVYDGGV